MRVLVFISNYLPGYKYGGPVRSLANLTTLSEKRENLSFYIITRNRDFGEKKPYEDIRTKSWTIVNSANVLYIRNVFKDFLYLIKQINNISFDSYYFNSAFSPKFTLLFLLLIKLKIIPSKKIIISPRGEFSPGALELKNKKKSVFLKLARIFKFYKNIDWQAASSVEKGDIKKIFSDYNNIFVLPNIPYFDENLNPIKHKEKNELSVVFISRISRKKNLEFILQVLKKIEFPVRFNIYGPIEDKRYWKYCNDLISSLPKHILVNYGGTIDNSKVREKFQSNDIFFFPTKGENFGHIIFESLAAGCPPLISTNTPWNDIEEERAGWVCNLNSMKDFVSILEKIYKMDNNQYNVYRQNSFKYAKNNYQKIVKQNLEYFDSLNNYNK
jgi:glycosyltransferase involved in cell wall biosynthesis